MGLTVSAGIASWVEFTLLRRRLNRRIGTHGHSAAYLARLWIAAASAAAVGWLIHHFFRPHAPVLVGIVVLIPYGIDLSWSSPASGIDEAQSLMRRVLRRLENASWKIDHFAFHLMSLRTRR